MKNKLLYTVSVHFKSTDKPYVFSSRFAMLASDSKEVFEKTLAFLTDAHGEIIVVSFCDVPSTNGFTII